MFRRIYEFLASIQDSYAYEDGVLVFEEDEHIEKFNMHTQSLIELIEEDDRLMENFRNQE